MINLYLGDALNFNVPDITIYPLYFAALAAQEK